MARIPGPLNVQQTPLRNNRGVVAVTPDESGARLAAVGDAVGKIVGAARDQQIENEVAQAEIATRRDLDGLTRQLENDEGDPAEYEQRFTEAAGKIVENNAGRLTSPAHQRLWRERMDLVLERERQGVANLAQRRVVEAARGGLIASVSAAEAIMGDESATPQARAEALSLIETQVRRAAARRVIAADDAETMIARARTTAAEFSRQAGLRLQAQEAEDRIWAESGGDLAAALEMSRDLSGALRDSVEDRLAVRFSRTEAAEREQLDDSMERAYASIEQSGSLDSIGPHDREVIIRNGQMDTLRTYLRAKAGVNGESWTALNRESQLVRDTLLAEAIDNPVAFAERDLSAIRSQLMPDDYVALRQKQEQLNGRAPVGQGSSTLSDRAYDMLRAYAEPVARAQGVELSDRKENREDTDRFRAFLLREARDFVTANRRLPDQRDIEQITQLALREASAPGFLGMGTNRRRVFEAREGSPVRVRFPHIPEYQRQRLARLYAQSGRPRPESEAAFQAIIEQMYLADLEGSAQ